MLALDTRCRLAATALAALVLAIELVAPARASAVTCGDALTESVTLDADMICGVNGGLIVFGDDITIDLAGHSIFGSSQYGIDNTLGFNRVTVKNGKLDGFGTGIFMGGGEGHTIRGVDVRGQDNGIELSVGTRLSKIQKTRVGDTIGAVIKLAGNDNLLSQVVVVNAGGVGILVTGSRNTVSKSTIAAVAAGIVVSGNPTENVFTRNTISATNGVGILTAGTGSQVTKNLIEGNAGAGISLFDAGGGLVSGNTLIGNQANGIFVDPGSNGNQLIKNVATANHLDGILVAEGASATVAVGNKTSRNRGDGIDFGDPNGTIGKNTAETNGGFGIKAVSGVVDGGGNKAHNNGQANCTAPEITCK